MRIIARVACVTVGAVAYGLVVGAPAMAQSAASKAITIVLPEEPDNLDGCNSNHSALGRIVKQNIVETLTKIDPADGSIAPRLALSWEKKNDTTWRFQLRKGVVFTDGAPLNAETASKAISRTIDSSLACEDRVRRFGDLKIKGMPVDEFTLDIVSNKPAPILPTMMGVLSLSSPNTPTDKFVLNPVGTGPFVLDHFTPGQEVVLKRNDKYWGNKPEIETARYIWRVDSAISAAMVKIGEADIAPNIAVQDATDPTMDFSYLNAETTYMRIDELPPFDDKRVRLALFYATDHNSIRGTLLSKDVMPATQVVVPAIAGHNGELDKHPIPYDPAKARQLLAEAKAAGVPVDRAAQMIGRINHYPNATEIAEALLGMFKAVGFNVSLRMTEVGEWNAYNSKPFAANRPPILFMHQHDNNAGDPVFSVFSRYTCDGGGSTHCNPDLDKLINQAAVMSGQERVDAWKEVFRVVYQDMAADLFLFHMVGYSRVGPRIDFKPSTAINSEILLQDITFK